MIYRWFQNFTTAPASPLCGISFNGSSRRSEFLPMQMEMSDLMPERVFHKRADTVGELGRDTFRM